jgi:hypothetical protein
MRVNGEMDLTFVVAPGNGSVGGRQVAVHA